MQHTHRSPRIRLAIIAAATMFVAGACGSPTTLSSPIAPTAPAVTSEAPTTAPTPEDVPPEPTAAPASDEESDVPALVTTVDPPTAPTSDPVTGPADPPADIDDFASPDDDLGCGPLFVVPDDALIGSDLWFSLDGGDVDDDRLVSYFDGTWKLRVEFSGGAQSEVEIPGASVHDVRVLGFADVDLAYGGEEIMAVVGGGASTVEIGVFSFLEGGCIFRYQADGGGDFSVYSGASVTHGSGIVCGEGYVTSWGFERDDDDTYAVWDSSFEPISLGVFGYMPSSDGHAEGLSFEDLSDTLFDCNGLSL